MHLNKVNSLVELFFKKIDEVDKKKPFLKWLKKDKPTYNWGEIEDKVYKLTS